MTSLPVNGNYINGHKSVGLEIAVVGAGIAGLSAAIDLRKQGHHVQVSELFHLRSISCNHYDQVFEQSAFAREAGAAVHVVPNANGILRRLGIRTEDIEANKME